MNKTPLPFKVPKKHQRFCVLFTEDEQAKVALQVGNGWFRTGGWGRDLTDAEKSRMLDWLGAVMHELRTDLGHFKS